MTAPEDIRIPSHGEQLAAYLYRPESTQGDVPCVVMAHGFSAPRDDGLPAYGASSHMRRAQILEFVNGKVADIRTRLPRAFATLVPGRLIIKRVPVEIEAGAPGGYAAAGTIDGSVPGNYYINLRDTAMWPRYASYR